jgi:crotonobetainyl-CoA:carnitine CoA-transferase CaiB-like acyl-CoA transferase
VIKLEPLDGDLLRPTTVAFNCAGRGKRSIAVNLKRPEGRGVAYRLAGRADVVTHNMRPGAAERLGMDYDSIRAINEQVVYAYAPGWGISGPDADRPGFAPLFAGYCGLQYEAAGEGNDPAWPVGNEDNGNGLVGAAAILMALYHRARTGEGQYLDNPQVSATLLMGMHMMRTPDGRVLGSRGLDSGRLGIHPLDRLYRTADGWLCLSARLDAEFSALGSVPGFEDLGADEHFAGEENRLIHAAELQDRLQEVFERSSGAEWIEQLDHAGVPCEIPASRSARQDFFDDLEQGELGRTETYEHPRWGTVQDVAVLLRMSTAQRRPSRPAPELGQHTREILSELQFADPEIDALFEGGVVR